MNAERPIEGLVCRRVTTRRGKNREGLDVVEIRFHYDGPFPSSTVMIVPANEMNVWRPLNDARPSFA